MQVYVYLLEHERAAEFVCLGNGELTLELYDADAPCSSYPRAVLDSVLRVDNPILVENTQLHELGDIDLCVARRRVGSFICYPVVRSGHRAVAVWLECRQGEADFSFADLDVLESLMRACQQEVQKLLEEVALEQLQQLLVQMDSRRDLEAGFEELEGLHPVESHLRMFETAVRAADSGFLIVDARLPDQPIIYCNPAFEKITGYAFREVVGRNCRFLQKPGEEPEKLARLRAAIHAGETCQIVLRNYRKDGTLFWNELTVSPVKDKQGDVTYLIGVQNDVSERFRIEELRRDSESRFRALFDNSLDGIAYFSLDGHCISTNQAYCDMLGYEEQEILKARYEDITPLQWHGPENDIIISQLLVRGYTDLYEKEYIRKDGSIFPVSVRAALHYDAEGNPAGIWSIVRDISQYKEAIASLREKEARMEYLAYHDALTQLPNRLLFQDRVSQALERARRSGRKLAVMLLDLDRFKNINDSLGHAIGDCFLKEISSRITGSIREADTAARIGGDEFVVVLEDLHDINSATGVANKLLKVLARPVRVEEHELYTTASIGISVFPGDGDSVDSLIKAADAAMYRAKEKGKNNFHYFTEDINRRTFELLLLENDLRRALDQQQLFVAYQPQFSIDGGELVGVEALMRWNHPAEGLIAPGKFIPVAEETGLIVPLGRWMLRESCTQIKAWLDQGYKLGRIAVNLSVRQFRQPGLVEDITRILQEVGLGPEHLELEITESIAMDNVEATVEKLEVLKRMGLQLSIDDFGTGYSSLSYLKRFAIDKLKIDQSFVRDIATDPNDAAIAASTIALAHKMGLKVIAEGVETREQVAFLHEQGCDEVQGYYYGRPMTAADFEKMLSTASYRRRARFSA